MSQTIDVTKRTAIIYSVDDMFSYIVEIRHFQESYFIGTPDEPEQFGNLEGARNAALSQNAQQAFLALSKTYEEVQSDSHEPLNIKDRYDYLRIDLSLL